MKQMETSSPRPSPPQVCGGEGEEARGGGVKLLGLIAVLASLYYFLVHRFMRKPPP
ncbi:MAG: hypothetical protein ABSG78_04780 [Verrucomicrobiota bacterium]